LYSLIPLEDFKAVLGIDDREDKLARFCLVTSTFAIEQYCKRRLLSKQYFEQIEYIGDLLLPLREYPVSQVLSVYLYGNGEILEPDFYNIIPDCGSDYDLPFSLSLSRAIQRQSRISAIKAVYWAGYVANPHPCGFTTTEPATQTPPEAIETAASRGEPQTFSLTPRCGSVEYAMPPVPPDLSAACLELASWNMNRYKGRRVGMTGNVRGAGRMGNTLKCRYRKM